MIKIYNVKFSSIILLLVFSAKVVATTCGETWVWANPWPHGNTLNSVAYGNGKFVAVGNSGTIQTSLNKENWIIRNSSTTNNLYSVKWIENEFIAVGENGTILTSSDGENWIQHISHTTNELHGIAKSNDKFVVVGNYGTILTSTDSITWNNIQPVTTNDLNGVIWSGSQFVAVGSESVNFQNDRTAPILTSPNGETWTRRDLGRAYLLQSVAWNGSLFVAVGAWSTIITSPDGITWTGHATNISYFHLETVTWTGNQFIAVGYPAVIFTSADGITWNSDFTLTSMNYVFQDVVWDNNQFMVVGEYGTILLIYKGGDGDIYIHSTGSVGTTNRLHAVTWNNNQFVAVGDNGTILTSTGGITWFNRFSNTNNQLDSIAVINNQFITMDTGEGSMLMSQDGINWVSYAMNGLYRFYNIAWNGNQFVAVPNIATSQDGINWIYSGPQLFYVPLDVIWYRNQFVAVGEHGTIMTSPDAINWTSRDSGIDYYLYSITSNDNQMVAVGGDGAVLTSLDGVTWTQRNANTMESLYDVIWNGSKFIAVGSNGTILISFNGIDWTSQNSGTINYLVAIAWDDNQLVVVGDGGTVLRSGICRIVTPNAGIGGNVNPNTVQSVNYGTTITFAVTPNTGYIKNPTVGGTCPAGNWNGNVWTTGSIIANCTVNFNFIPLAAVATTLAATNLTATSATLNGSVNSNNATATVSFELGTTTAYGINIVTTPSQVFSNTAVAVTASKTNLICNTTYNYRVKAVNSAGTSLGANRSFKTLACLPTASTNLAEAVTASSATLVGQIIPNGAVTTVTFELGTTTAYGLNPPATPNTIAANAGNTRVTYAATGLNCNTTYNYRVKAVNSVGTSFGVNKSFKTSICPKTPHALIIGGRTTADDALSSMLLSRTLTRVYSALKAQGFRDSRDGPYDEIRLLGNGLSVTLPSGATISAQPVAISDFAAGTTLTQWASSGERLVIYLVGHGNPGVFYLDQVTNALFSATALDAWLDLVQPQLPSTSSGSTGSPNGDIALVYEACYSGSFLPVLTATNRMLFASAAADQRAFFANNGLISYSYSFWSEIEMGSDLKQAQQKASLDMEMHQGTPQTPQLEANGNAIANESGDLQLAADRCLGFLLKGNQVVRDCTFSAAPLPVIKTVAPALTVSGARSADLWLTVDLLEADTIQAAWVAITRPDFQTDSNLAFDQVPIINLVRDANFDEKWVGRYAPGDKNAAGEIQRGLDVAGKYELAYYVMHTNGMISILKPSAITQTQGLAPGRIAPALFDTDLGQLNFPIAQLWNGGNSRSLFTRNAAGLWQLSANSATSLAVTNPPRWNATTAVVNIPQLIQAGDTQIYRGTLKRESATGTQSQWTFNLTIANFICGDADNNGMVNIVDALAVARKVVNVPPPPAVNDAADVDGNGQIAIADALNIAKFAVGLAASGTCLQPQ